jgi:hypothetical protein
MTNMDAHQRPLIAGSSRNMSAAEAIVCAAIVPDYHTARRSRVATFIDCGC